MQLENINLYQGLKFYIYLGKDKQQLN